MRFLSAPPALGTCITASIKRISKKMVFLACGLLVSGFAYADADMALNQNVTPTSAPAGSQFSATFDVSNTGPDPADNAYLTVTFTAIPLGGSVTLLSVDVPGCVLVDSVMTCDLDTLPIDTQTVNAVFSLNDGVGAWTLVGTVGSTTNDPEPPDNTSTTNVTTTISSDLVLTADPVPTLTAGQAFDYHLKVKNLGPGDVVEDGMEVTFTVPSNVQYTGFMPPWSCTPNNGPPGTAVTCTTVALSAGSTTDELIITAVSLGSQSGTTNTQFSVNGYNPGGSVLPDPNMGNNTVTVPATVTLGTNVSIQKTVTTTDEYLLYTLTPSYLAGDSLNDVTITITDRYDSGEFTFVAWNPDPASSGWSCTLPASNGTLMEFTCTRPGYSGDNFTDMPSISFTAIPGAMAVSATNTATIDLTDRPDPDTSNNDSSVVIDTSGYADLTTRKSASFSPVLEGQDFEYRIYTVNNGPWGVPNGQAITITDQLPDQLTLTAAPSGSNWTCNVTQNGSPATYPATSTAASPVIVTCEYTNGLASTASTPTITLPVQSNTSNPSLVNDACSALAQKVSATDREDNDLTNNCSSSHGGGGVAITDQDADLVISKTVSPDPVDAGQPLTYTITIINNGPETATNVTMNDALGSLVRSGGLQALSITTQPGSGDGACSIDGNLTPTLPMNGTSHTLQCVFPAIATTDQAVIQAVVLPNIALTGNRTNTATVYSADQADSVRDDNTGSATSVVEGVFDLGVTTEASTPVITPATEAAANSILSFVTHVSSLGLSTAPTAQAVIQFPANAEIIQITSTGGADSCVPDLASLAGTTGMSMTCQWNPGIPANNTRDITYQVMVPNDVGNTISHQANVSLIEPGEPRPETDLTNNDARAQVTITPATSDIQVIIEDAPDPVLLGSMVTYTIRVKNNGPSIATNIGMNAAYAPATAVFSYQGGLTVDQGGHCTEPQMGTTQGFVACNWNSLASGVEAIVTYQMQADVINTAGATSGLINTSATVNATEIDQYPTNNDAAETTSAYRDSVGPGSPESDLDVTKTSSATSVVPGAMFNYTITVHNNGPDDVVVAQGAQIIDTLPPELTLVSTPAGCTYDETTNVVTCLIGALANGADYVVVLPVRLNSQVAQEQTITNTVITDLPTDPNPDNNQDDVSVQAMPVQQIPVMPQWGLVILAMLITVCAGIYQSRKARSR